MQAGWDELECDRELGDGSLHGSISRSEHPLKTARMEDEGKGGREETHASSAQLSRFLPITRRLEDRSRAGKSFASLTESTTLICFRETYLRKRV